MNELTIRAFKYGNIKHYEWKSTLVEKNDKFVIGKAKPGRVLYHYTRDKKFTFDNWSIEFFPLDKWFNVMVDIKEKKVVQYYCNVAKPANIKNDNIVSFVDLDFDLLKKNGEWSVLDADDFKENQNKLDYPEDLIEKTKIKLEELKKRINNKIFPFDGFIQDYVSQISKEIFTVSGYAGGDLKISNLD
ncbi:MAG: DUF402 domain-containing protein [Bacillota bacterium]